MHVKLFDEVLDRMDVNDITPPIDVTMFDGENYDIEEEEVDRLVETYLL